jgi:hypothetical protein
MLISLFGQVSIDHTLINEISLKVYEPDVAQKGKKIEKIHFWNRKAQNEKMAKEARELLENKKDKPLTKFGVQVSYWRDNRRTAMVAVSHQLDGTMLTAMKTIDQITKEVNKYKAAEMRLLKGKK